MKTVLSLLALCLLIVACSNAPASNTQGTVPPQSEGDSSIPPTPIPQTPPELPPSNDEPTTSASEVKEITMDVNEYAFSPNMVAAQEGTTLRITLTNSGDKAHGFAIPDLNINERIAPGETKVITIDADQAGSYSFLCSVPCGSGHSRMTGTLVVS